MIGKNFSNGWKKRPGFSNDWKLFFQWLENFFGHKEHKAHKVPNPFVVFVSFVAEPPFPNDWKTFPTPGGCGFQPRPLSPGAA